MRHLNAAFIALIATYPALISALPSTAAGHQPAPWRRLSNSIISSIWRASDNGASADARTYPISEARARHSSPLAARYGQDIVLRFSISTAEEVKAIAEAAEDLYLDIWGFCDDWVDIRLAKDVLPSLLGLLPASLQNAHVPLMPQSALAEVISESIPSPDHPSFSPELKPSSRDLFFSDYQPLSVIEPWMRLLASMFPTHTRIVDIGVTYEGRPIRALRVGVHPTNDDQPSFQRRTIIISGGIHAREWISTSSVNYVAYRLITGYGKSNLVTRMLEAFDFIFIPTLNPDGYVYTWTTDRLWRKNRQPTPLRFCHGIDLDRSFGFHWDGDTSPSGSNPCSESYAGEEPWQAREAQALAEWASNETQSNNVQFIAFIDLHSYSQQVLYPYSYSCNAAPPTLENLEELALGLAKAMRLAPHGHEYSTTSACEGNVVITATGRNGKEKRVPLPRIIQTGGGSGIDWFYGELKLKYAYQIKLRDRGSYGFLLPRGNIVPQGKEVLGAVKYLGRYLMGEVGLTVEDDYNEKEIEEGREDNVARQMDLLSHEKTLGQQEDDKSLLHTDEIQQELKRVDKVS